MKNYFLPKLMAGEADYGINIFEASTRQILQRLCESLPVG
jgi:hypothetical protein